MCGIVGLLIKADALRGRLGEWSAPMLDCMGDRGADSAGMAVFADDCGTGARRISLFLTNATPNDWESLIANLTDAFEGDAELFARGPHATLKTTIEPAQAVAFLREQSSQLRILGVGRSMEVYKDVGHPRTLIERYGLREVSGSHVVGHTRMATESAVSVAHSHPFTAGEDFCLVHNGSLSNPYSIRRRLERKGIAFETDNDTEAACRFLQWRLQSGDTLEAAIEKGFEELDGFYTLLIGTATRLVLVRDPFACKPAVAAETDDYVAISSEYRSLAHLPGIRDAHVFEPAPERIYSWTV
ncbi:MAG: amidophosphoribosyltransferase [Planctomycetaceae bacterium]|nr:amidophosphoribosyltransferase [Planctomycetaceae bacterium]